VVSGDDGVVVLGARALVEPMEMAAATTVHAKVDTVAAFMVEECVWMSVESVVWDVGNTGMCGRIVVALL
jgi:hypothetical protein